jgi:hypothetical protein
MSFGFAVVLIDSFMKRGLNIHSGEEQQTMKREPKFVRKQTFGAVLDGMTDRPVGTH